MWQSNWVMGWQGFEMLAVMGHAGRVRRCGMVDMLRRCGRLAG